jgi:hypothetical protein
MHRARMIYGYARVSTDAQDLTSPRNRPELGAATSNVDSMMVLRARRHPVRNRLAAGAKEIRTPGPSRIRYVQKRLPPLSFA